MPASRDFLAWAQTLPSTGAAGRAYREPQFEDSRALSKADARQLELQDAREAITKAVLHKGGDTPGSPGEGDLVVCHLSLRTCDDEERLVFTTRLDEGGAGVPLREALASDACALLRGVELALAAFTRGERAVLRLPPEFAFGHKCCAGRRLAPPRGMSAKHDVFADVELLDFHPCKVVSTEPTRLVAKRILREGRGLETPHAPYEVVLHLAGQLPARWDSHGKPAAPAEVFLDKRELAVTLGAAHLPPSLEAAVSSMRPGERASVFCGSPCAVGPAAALPELPRAAPHGVEWTVELVDIVQVRDMYGDGSLIKRRTRVGTGDFPVDCPLHDCTVRIQLTTAALLPSGPQLLGGAPSPVELEFELGTGAQPPGLESSIRLMVPGETAQVVAAPRHGYEARPPGWWTTPPGLASGSRVQWTVTLVGFDAPVNWHRAEVPDILADAARAKEAGVALFRQQHWALARSRFEAVAGKLGGLRGLGAEEEVQATQLRASCLLNAAAAAQRQGEHAAAVAHCSTVLAKLDAGSAKAMYRRGVSHIALGNWEQAAADLEATVAADLEAAPDCEKQLARLRAAQRDAAVGINRDLSGFLA